MRFALLILLFPILLFAQDFEFELEPDAFPVEIDGWQPFQPWAGGNHPTTPEFSDIDGDGDLDYFSGSAQNYYWFFENIGTATTPNYQYNSATFDSVYPVCPGSAFESDLDFADVDDDGDLDAFLCNGIIGLLINNGTPSLRDFSSPPDTLFTTSSQYLSATNMAAADIDADGDLDLFGGTYYSGELRFFENTGTPQNYQYVLITESWQGVQAAEGKADPCFADLDADGDLDLLVGSAAGTIYYYCNDSTATDPLMTYITDNYLGIDVGENASPELADIDGDGDLDLFIGRSPFLGQTVTQGDVFFYRNEGTPQIPDFQFVTSNYLTWDCGFTATPRLVDIDADGDPDLMSHIGDRLLFYRNQGTLQSPLFTFESDSFGGVIVFDLLPWFCDIDADGDYDLLAGETAIPGPPGLHLYINRGTPQQPDFALYSDDLVPGVFTTGTVGLTPWTADIDADGDLDLFVVGGLTLYFFQNVGSASSFQFEFITSDWQNVASSCFGGIFFGCFYDIDDDGDFDLFVNNNATGDYPWDKNLLFFKNEGTPQDPVMVLENEDLFPELMIWQACPFLLDMDQDGYGDLFVGDHRGGIRFFRNITGQSEVGPRRPEVPYPKLDFYIGPNPANPITWISFSLPAPQEATLAVYNILGAKVTTLASGLQMPGTHNIIWNASQYSSGVYIIRLETPQNAFSQRVMVVK